MSIFKNTHPVVMFIENSDLASVQAAALAKRITLGTIVVIVDVDSMYLVRPNVSGPGYVLKAL